MIHLIRTRFGDYDNWKITEAFTKRVFDILSTCSNVPLIGDVVIVHSHKGPICTDPTPENLEILSQDGIHLPTGCQPKRILCLNVEAVYWSQWIYQLAHEVCHHLINGTMYYLPFGLQWFEECLCHTASLFCLSILANATEWNQWGCPHYALSLREYIDDNLYKRRQLREVYYQMNHWSNPQGIQMWLPFLNQRQNRIKSGPIYETVAHVMLPIFLRTNSLWEIIGHIGHSENWQSLDELLTHIESAVSLELLAAVRELRMVLLGR